MSSFPNVEDYERSMRFMPWGVTVEKILELVGERVPAEADILDMICGPGHISKMIMDIKPRAKIVGVDIDEEAIDYAKEHYPGIKFVHADANTWQSEKKFDFILVNAGLHHLYYFDQTECLRKLKTMIKPDGFAIIADPYIGEYVDGDERSRAIAAARLGYQVIKETLATNPPEDIADIAYSILATDILELGEFKNSVARLDPVFRRIFSRVEVLKTWPQFDSDFGEYMFIVQ